MLSSARWQQGRFIWKAIQVRLRFVALLGIVFLLIGRWDWIRSAFDATLARVSNRPTLDQAVSTDVEFFCPMDPGVINDWPSICPVCNMVLVKRKKGEMAVLPEGVVARMQFSPYRIQLAGIRTVSAKLKPLRYMVTVAGALAEVATAGQEKLTLQVSLPGRYGYLKWEGRTAKISTRDIPGIEPLVGKVLSQTATGLQIEVDNPNQLLRTGLWAMAQFEIPFDELEPFRSLPEKFKAGTILTIPASAVVDFGSHRLVYVETEPGLFDGLEVILGPRCDAEYPVLHGLSAGQKVAMTGAFLIDAEARLNPNLAAGYFGASQRTTAPPPSATLAPEATAVNLQQPQIKPMRLSKEDTALAHRQRICPVTGFPLDSMGGPMPLVVKGRRVFICCAGCESRLKQEPEKYFAKLPRP